MYMYKNKILKSNKGQSIVEFSLIVPILLLVIMGIMEFGMLFNDYLSISNASRDGARYASLGESDAEVVNAIHDVLPMIDSSKLTVTISPSYSSRDRGDTVSVKLVYNYDVTLPIISSVIGNSIPLTSQTTMRVE